VRLWPKHWHAETWICSLQGHVTPARWASTFTSEDRPLGFQAADGLRLSRCLRCDCWIEHIAPTAVEAHYATVPVISEIPKPRRGEVLHDAIVMRVIAINKGVHAMAFTLIATALVLLRTRLTALKGFADRMLRSVQDPLGQTGQGTSRTWLADRLESILKLKGSTLGLLLALAIVYAVVEWVEAFGLWRQRHWAEYLTVIATAGFLPLEIHELTKRVTALRVIALAVNVALVVWLIRNKRLFGVRGGRAALHEQTDWAAILASPSPAQGRLAQPR
jgi:uncharacterized membrane protein (DUF2068 family)